MAITMRVERINPDTARFYLDQRPEHQRQLNLPHVRALADAMTAGTFVNPQPIIFDTENALMDGQHRLAAIIRSGTTQAMNVIYGAPADSFGSIDIGFRRQAGQFLESAYSTTIATAAKLWAVYRADHQVKGLAGGARALTRYPIPEVVAIADANPTLQRWANDAVRVGQLTHISRPSLLAISALGAVGADDMRIADWFTGLREGADLQKGDARLALRNVFGFQYKLLNRPSERRIAWGLIVKAWNGFMTEDNILRLRYSQSEPMPSIWGAKE